MSTKIMRQDNCRYFDLPCVSGRRQGDLSSLIVFFTKVEATKLLKDRSSLDAVLEYYATERAYER